MKSNSVLGALAIGSALVGYGFGEANGQSAPPCCADNENAAGSAGESDRRSLALPPDLADSQRVRLVDGDGEVQWEGTMAELQKEFGAVIDLKSDDGAAVDGTAAEVTSLATSIDPLVDHFNSSRATRRFVALLSSTCPACVFGAKAVRDEVLAAHSDEEMSVSIVWLDMLPTDGVRSVASASRIFDDPRVRQFHDPNRIAGQAMAQGLLYEDAGPAWDVYLFYGAGAEWTGEPPAPSDWCHQLSGGRRADPSRFTPGNALRDALRTASRRWLRSARADPPLASVKRAALKRELELLYIPQCPNHDVVRERLTEALGRCGVHCAIRDVDLAELPESDARRGYGSPTVLFNGVDIFGSLRSDSRALTCRLYDGGAAPSVDELCKAICTTVCTTSPGAGCRSLPALGGKSTVGKDPNRTDCPGRIVCPLTGDPVCVDRCPLLIGESTADVRSTPSCCAGK